MLALSVVSRQGAPTQLVGQVPPCRISYSMAMPCRDLAGLKHGMLQHCLPPCCLRQPLACSRGCRVAVAADLWPWSWRQHCRQLEAPPEAIHQEHAADKLITIQVACTAACRGGGECSVCERGKYNGAQHGQQRTTPLAMSHIEGHPTPSLPSTAVCIPLRSTPVHRLSLTLNMQQPKQLQLLHF